MTRGSDTPIVAYSIAGAFAAVAAALTLYHQEWLYGVASVALLVLLTLAWAGGKRHG